MKGQLTIPIATIPSWNDIARTVSRFQRFAPKRIVFNKIDLADSKSLSVGSLLRIEIAISYITNGQRVPDDRLVPGNAEMIKWVLPDA